jgi:hypothetical protein
MDATNIKIKPSYLNCQVRRFNYLMVLDSGSYFGFLIDRESICRYLIEANAGHTFRIIIEIIILQIIINGQS